MSLLVAVLSASPFHRWCGELLDRQITQRGGFPCMGECCHTVKHFGSSARLVQLFNGRGPQRAAYPGFNDALLGSLQRCSGFCGQFRRLRWWRHHWHWCDNHRRFRRCTASGQCQHKCHAEDLPAWLRRHHSPALQCCRKYLKSRFSVKGLDHTLRLISLRYLQTAFASTKFADFIVAFEDRQASRIMPLLSESKT